MSEEQNRYDHMTTEQLEKFRSFYEREGYSYVLIVAGILIGFGIYDIIYNYNSEMFQGPVYNVIQFIFIVIAIVMFLYNCENMTIMLQAGTRFQRFRIINYMVLMTIGVSGVSYTVNGYKSAAVFFTGMVLFLLHPFLIMSAKSRGDAFEREITRRQTSTSVQSSEKLSAE